MSWSIEVTGSKEGASKRVTETLDKCAESYAGKPEADDVIAARVRILALIEATDLSSDGHTLWNAVIVKANGSHSSNGKGLTNASFQLSVTRTALAL
jgi:hypothetical protein